MSFLNKYPYTDFHELNLDWFLAEFARVTEKVGTLEETVQQFTEFVTNYFDNLDVQQEVNRKLDQMVADGTISDLLLPLFDSYEQEINTRVAAQDAAIANHTQQIGTLDARVSSFEQLAEGSTTGDAELIDGRVGANGVTYTNIGDAIRAQASDVEKMAQNNTRNIQGRMNGGAKSVDFNRMDLYAYAQYMKVDGTLGSGGPHNVVRISDPTIKQVTLPAMATTNLPALVVKKNSTVLLTVNGDVSDPVTVDLDFEYTDLFFNWWYSNTTPDYTGITVEYEQAARQTDFAALWLNQPLKTFVDKLQYVQDGYITYTGAIISAAQHKIYKTDASYLTFIRVECNTALPTNLAYGMVKDAGGNIKNVFQGTNSTDPYEWNLNPTPGDELFLVLYNYATPLTYYDSVEMINYPPISAPYADEIGYQVLSYKFPTSVTKPYSFSGKRLYAFGDSIMYGYLYGGTRATNEVPKVFAQMNSCTYVNNAANSSSFAAVSGYPQIINQIVGSDLNCDFMMILGGVNDWQLGVDEATLESALITLCDYLRANYSGRVIFITPINEAGRIPIKEPQQTLQNVRNVITRTAIEYGYDVVQGTDVPFPTRLDDAGYIAAMYGDKLHPTELGYKTLAKTLSGILN